MKPTFAKRKTYRRIKEYPTFPEKSGFPIPNYGDNVKVKSMPKKKNTKQSPNISWKEMGKKKLEDASKEWLEEKAIPAILSEAEKLAGKMKVPVGATGINLQRTGNRQVSILSPAIGGVTNSASMYAYRKPRNKVEDAIQYAMKTKAADYFTRTAGYQGRFDINILDAEPVENNPDSNEKYSNLTIRHAFDKYLLSTFEIGSDDYRAKIQQSSIHVKSLTIDLAFTNTSTNTMFLDFWELVPQHNLGPTPYASVTYKANGYMSPYWTMEQGLNATDVLEVEDDLDPANISANPYNSTLFSRTWKEVKKVRVNMSPGAVHRHKAVYAINKTVSYQEMAQFATSGGKFASWNPTYFCIFKGAPGLTDDEVPVNTIARSCGVSYVADMQLNYEATPSRQAKVIVFDDKT